MRLLKYIAPILAAALCSFWSCSDDDTKLAEAVLASAGTLNFDGTGASPQIITVYADADWVTEVPDWITVSPTSGSGVMDVTISVSDNIREGALDNPRKANVVFKGRTLASRAPVLVIQAGDKYRDVKDYTPGEIAPLANETVVSVPDVFVMAVTTAGFVMTDEQQTANIYVLSSETVAVGDKVSIMGSKTTAQSLPAIEADEVSIVSSGNTVTYPTPKDITDIVDSYTSGSREFIEVSGVLDGTNIIVADATYSVSVVNAPASMGLAALNGHKLIARGYFAGVAAPVVRIMLTDIEDKGEQLEILAEWMLPGKTITDGVSSDGLVNLNVGQWWIKENGSIFKAYRAGDTSNAQKTMSYTTSNPTDGDRLLMWGLQKGDYWQMEIPTTGIAAGSTLKIVGEMQSSGTGARDFLIQYSPDESSWVPVNAQTDTHAQDASFTYTIRMGNAVKTAVSQQFVVDTAIPAGTLYIRFLVSSNVSAGGTNAIGLGGSARVCRPNYTSDEDKNPIMRVIKM